MYINEDEVFGRHTRVADEVSRNGLRILIRQERERYSPALAERPEHFPGVETDRGQAQSVGAQ